MLFLQIVWTVIAPIFLLIVLGVLVQRKIGFDVRTLTRLNFWVFVPAFLFSHFTKSTLDGPGFIAILVHFGLYFPLLFAVAWMTASLLGYSERLKRAFTSSIIFYNSGNYGIPVAELAFKGEGAALQAFVIALQNLTNFTVGLGLQAGGSGLSRREQLAAIARMPMIYTFGAAILWRTFQLPLPAPLDTALTFLSGGLVPVALITLGAQMATLDSYRITPVLAITLFYRLLIGPTLGLLVLLFMNSLLHFQISGVFAQALVVSTSFPTAVNSALLAIEYENEPDYAASAVFYSTLASMVTVSLVISLVKLYMA